MKIVFPLTLIANLLVAAMVGFSIAWPRQRLWPPSRPGRGWAYAMWVVFFACSAGILALGVLDWGAFPISPWLRWGVGAPLWLGGLALIHRAMYSLGWARSFGEARGLNLRGPYQFSRNPQYVGFIAALVGWPLVASSGYTLILGLLGAAVLCVTPLAEESWLREKYGAAYEEYCRSVPRFLPWRRRAR